jgi:hypothetical protein
MTRADKTPIAANPSPAIESASRSRSVTIRTTEGPEDVEAEVYGVLAVHEGVNGKKLNNLTHVSTGKSVIRDLTELEALLLARILCRLDWENYDVARKEEFRLGVRQAAKGIAGPQANIP